VRRTPDAISHDHYHHSKRWPTKADGKRRWLPTPNQRVKLITQTASPRKQHHLQRRKALHTCGQREEWKRHFRTGRTIPTKSNPQENGGREVFSTPEPRRTKQRWPHEILRFTTVKYLKRIGK